jgi:cytochrome c553
MQHYLITAILMTLLIGFSHAQDTTDQTADQTTDAQATEAASEQATEQAAEQVPEATQQVAEKTGQELSVVCAACHGADGNSAMAIWPKLAGQHEQYMTRQSIMIREGQRMVPQMMGIVANMTDEQLAKISQYYSEQQIKPGSADPELVPLGKKIYHTGLLEKNVAACQSCHGPVGAGNPFSGYPKVAGQHADYLAQRLQKYRSGETNGEDDPYSAQMALVAQNLTDHEIEAVSSYLQGMYDKRAQE